MGESEISECIDSADVRPELTTFNQRGQFIELALVLPCEHEVITCILTPGFDEVLWLCDVHDRDDTAKLREHVWAVGQCIATERIEHDINPVAVRFPHYDIDVVFFAVVYDHVRPKTSCEVEVAFAYGGEYPRTYGFRDLDRHVTDPSRAAMDQDAFSYSEGDTRDQSLPRRTANQAQACCFEMA